MIKSAAWLGILLSLCALFGLEEHGPVLLFTMTWLSLWFLYLSFVNVGQAFYGFGWESMLVEAGFFAAFLGPAHSEPSIIPILILRWMLFRTELGAGLIKLRHDRCWRDLTCLYYHHETQPLPNPLSRYFHRLPKFAHKAGVVFSHTVQLIAPFFVFAPQPIAAFAGGLIILHQLLLIVSGNYAWLNWLTVVLALTTLSDKVLAAVLPIAVPVFIARSTLFDAALYTLLGGVLVLSIRPALNLVSKHQLMNYSYNPLHLVNAYGAFGSVSKERYEVILEGTDAESITPDTRWQEYEFKAKPGALGRRPPQLAPYHLRLDWLMWFLPFSVRVKKHGIVTNGYERWFINLVHKLLTGHKPILKLFRHNPFPEQPPRFIRASYYRYRFTTGQERRAKGAYWERTFIDEYLPPIQGKGLPGDAEKGPV
jgi:hypothetical protein